MKSILWETIRASERAAIAAAEHVNKGDKEAIDEAAVSALRLTLNAATHVRARVAIGEYEKDNSYGLKFGEDVGGGWVAGDPSEHVVHEWEFAVDPVEGTGAAAKGEREAMTVIAFGRVGCFFSSRVHYMEKLVYGRELADLDLHLDTPPADMVRLAAERLGRPPKVELLDRPRNVPLAEALAGAGAEVILIPCCDISAAYRAVDRWLKTDIYAGVGGTTEAVLAATIVKTMGGRMFARLWDGTGFGDCLGHDDLAGDATLVATGVTDGSVAAGVKRVGGEVVTQTAVFSPVERQVRHTITRHMTPH